ncbi:MAG: A24 family peptidase, partial [Alphaproteobacteria bacterium]
MPAEPLYLLYVAFPLALAYAAASDLLTMTISNWISVLLVAGFVALSPLTGMDLMTFGMHLSAGAVMLVITFTLFSLGWIGGGDAKLAAVVALWFGWTPVTVEFIGLS